MNPCSSPSDCLLEKDGRKRVCKACDRCRIKKSKCDGRKPCGRCRNDDAICIFAGRKIKSDRVHPKGYVEILERQQKQLIKGLRIMYKKHVQTHLWDGQSQKEGFPTTYDILDHLGALYVEESSSDEGSREESAFSRLPTDTSRRVSVLEEDAMTMSMSSGRFRPGNGLKKDTLVSSGITSPGQDSSPLSTPTSLAGSDDILSANLAMSAYSTSWTSELLLSEGAKATWGSGEFEASLFSETVFRIQEDAEIDLSIFPSTDEAYFAP